MSIPEITCDKLKEAIDAGDDLTIIDVRELDELDVSKIDGSVHIPLGDIHRRLDELNKDHAYVVQCRSGGRSATATNMLLENGFKNVRNLVGGINQWADEIDPNMSIY